MQHSIQYSVNEWLTIQLPLTIGQEYVALASLVILKCKLKTKLHTIADKLQMSSGIFQNARGLPCDFIRGTLTHCSTLQERGELRCKSWWVINNELHSNLVNNKVH